MLSIEVDDGTCVVRIVPGLAYAEISDQCSTLAVGIDEQLFSTRG